MCPSLPKIATRLFLAEDYKNGSLDQELTTLQLKTMPNGKPFIKRPLLTALETLRELGNAAAHPAVGVPGKPVAEFRP